MLARDLRQRALGPFDGAGVVARAKREAAHLLEKVRTLERIAVIAQAFETRRKAGAGALAVAGFPVQTADLPVQARAGRVIAAGLDLLQYRFVVRECLGPPPDEAQQIGEALARGACLALAELALGERAQRALVVTDRVVVGVNRTRPVAGRQQIAGSAWLIGAEAPVVAERFEVAEPLGVRAGGTLQRAASLLVQLGAARQQEILIDHLVHEGMSEAVSRSIASGSGRLDQIGLDQGTERERGSGWIIHDVPEQRLLELRAQYRRLL